MLLRKISLANYKSFLDEQTVEIGEGFNLFLGGNNSGKTTMLSVLDLQIQGAPHRSVWSIPDFGGRAPSKSNVQIVVETSLHELRTVFGNRIMIPIPSNFRESLGQNPTVQLAFDLLRRNPVIKIHLDFGSIERQSVETIFGRSDWVQVGSSETTHCMDIIYSEGGDNATVNIMNQSGQPPTLLFSQHLKQFFYRFSAQRVASPQSSFTGIPAVLSQDASNLAYCIANLQHTDAHGHRLLCSLVNRIFPSVAWIQAPSIDSNHFSIQCLPRPPEERRDDLAVPLTQMGTGIANVLAILYVVLRARHPTVIGIDEPNSFLHPKALRELLQILASEGAAHQFILTAHSAEVLTATTPAYITMFSASDGRTTVRQVGADDVAELRAELSDLGIRMTDLHGRDRILWVEGQTEEVVIPWILQKFCPHVSAGTAVLRVEHASKADKKGGDVKDLVASYERLTSSALVPPMVCVVLDSEYRTPATCRKLEVESNMRLRLLPRVMIENYLLHAGAIAATLLHLGEVVDETVIQRKLSEILDFGKINGARFLHDLFLDVSHARVEFRKTRDVPVLVEWILKNKPELLSPVGEFLNDVFEQAAKKRGAD